MNVVVDTNVVVSGLLWHGPPNQILQWVRDGILVLIACEETGAELKGILENKRFAKRLSALGASPPEISAYYSNLVFFVPGPNIIPEEIIEDPFDNLFLALASENRAHLIISGEGHLLQLKQYKHIQIVTPSEACQVIEQLVV